MTLGKMVKTSLCAAFLLAGFSAQIFSVDIKANVMVRGDLMRFEKDKATGDVESGFLLNNPVLQKDNPGDGLILEVDAGLAGAHLALWYKSATQANKGSTDYDDDDWYAYFRRTYVWFKPIDQLKIQLGYVGNDKHFKERIDEWKVGSPFAMAEREWSKHPGYINNCDAEGWGFGVEVRPIDQLVFNAAITPGKKGSVATDPVDVNQVGMKDKASIYKKTGDEKTLIAPWGAGVIYYWRDGIEFQASFRDGGMDAQRNGTWRVVRFGAGIKNEKTYSFIQPILGIDYIAADEAWKLNGMCLDLYSEYYLDAWTFILHAPVTFRWSDNKDGMDRNYMEATLKAKYNTGSHANMDDVSPYIQLGSNRDDALYDPQYRVWHLDKHFKDSFNLSYVLGVNFKIAIAEVDVGVKYDMLSDYAKTQYGKDWKFSVPFLVKIKNF